MITENGIELSIFDLEQKFPNIFKVETKIVDLKERNYYKELTVLENISQNEVEDMMSKIDQTEENYIRLAELSAKLVPYIINKNEEITETLLDIAPCAVKYLDENVLNENIWKSVLMSDGNLIKYLDPDKRTEELCLIAFKSNNESIKYTDPSLQMKIIEEADVLDYTFLKYLDKELLDYKKNKDFLDKFLKAQNIKYIKNLPVERLEYFNKRYAELNEEQMTLLYKKGIVDIEVFLDFDRLSLENYKKISKHSNLFKDVVNKEIGTNSKEDKEEIENINCNVLKKHPNLITYIKEPSLKELKVALNEKISIYNEIDKEIINKYKKDLLLYEDILNNNIDINTVDENIKELIYIKPDLIGKINRQTEELSMIALKKDIKSVSLIKNLSFNIISYVLKNSPTILLPLDIHPRYIIMAMKRIIINSEELIYKNVLNKNKETDILAVKIDERNIEYVGKETQELRDIAIEKNIEVYKKFKTKDLKSSLRYVQDGSDLKFLLSTDKIFNEIVYVSILKKDPSLFKYFPYQNERINKLAVSLMPGNIEFVQNKTREIVEISLDGSIANYEFIDSPSLEQNINYISSSCFDIDVYKMKNNNRCLKEIELFLLLKHKNVKYFEFIQHHKTTLTKEFIEKAIEYLPEILLYTEFSSDKDIVEKALSLDFKNIIYLDIEDSSYYIEALKKDIYLYPDFRYSNKEIEDYAVSIIPDYKGVVKYG